MAGFVIAGSGSKPLLARAVGPTLANFGVASPLADPSLERLKKLIVDRWGATLGLGQIG
jgi:hypothetical protein